MGSRVGIGMRKKLMKSRNIEKITAGILIAAVFTPAYSLARETGGLDTTGTMAPAVSFLKVIGALGLIIGLMALLFILLKKMGWNRTALKQGSLIQVLDSKMITPKKSIIVVRIGGDEILLLGVGEQDITLLSRLENKDLIDNGYQERPTETAGFAALLKKAAHKTETGKNQ